MASSLSLFPPPLENGIYFVAIKSCLGVVDNSNCFSQWIDNNNNDRCFHCRYDFSKNRMYITRVESRCKYIFLPDNLVIFCFLEICALEKMLELGSRNFRGESVVLCSYIRLPQSLGRPSHFQFPPRFSFPAPALPSSHHGGCAVLLAVPANCFTLV